MAKVTIPAAGNAKKVVIYTNYIESLNWFLTEPFEADEEGEATVGTRSVPGHQRRRGPSDDTPINVTQYTANYLIDPTLKSGNALPGRSFILRTDPRYTDDNETRRFTFTGRFLDLQAQLLLRIKYITFIYDSEGGRHTMKPIIGEPQLRR